MWQLNCCWSISWCFSSFIRYICWVHWDSMFLTCISILRFDTCPIVLQNILCFSVNSFIWYIYTLHSCGTGGRLNFSSGFGIGTETGRKLSFWRCIAFSGPNLVSAFSAKRPKVNLCWLHYLHYVFYPAHHFHEGTREPCLSSVTIKSLTPALAIDAWQYCDGVYFQFVLNAYSND